MKSFRRSVAVFSLGFGLMMSGAVSLPAMAGNSAFQEYGNNSGDIRGLVDRTQADLRAAGDIQHGQKERERYKHAQKSLSTFDRHLAKGKFDKDKLDDAIEAIQSVLDHNTLQASSRDALVRDVADLRAARAQR
jgi:ABC-type transporter Mla subunit MlaD